MPKDRLHALRELESAEPEPDDGSAEDGDQVDNPKAAEARRKYINILCCIIMFHECFYVLN